MKRIIPLLAVLLILFSSIPITAYAVSSDYTYNILSDNTIELTKYNGEEKAVEVPSQIDGYAVSKIGVSLFSGKNMTEVILPDTINEIKPYALSNNKLKEIIVPDSVITVGSFAFMYNSDLKQIYLGKNVSSLGERDFYRCTSLESIAVSPENDYLSVNDGVLLCNNESELVCYPSQKTGSQYKLPDSVKKVWCYAFEQTPVKTLDFNNAEIIENYSVQNTSLKELILPYGVTKANGISIGTTFTCKVYNPLCSFSFQTFSDLNYSITLYGYRGSTAEQTVLNADTSSKIKYYFEELEVPDSELTFEIADGKAALKSYVGSAKEVVIPESYNGCPVTSINDNVFYGNKYLEKIVIPDSVNAIGSMAFKECTALKEVHFPCSAVYSTNRSDVFDGCENIEKVVITKGNGVMPDYAPLSMFVTKSRPYCKAMPWAVSKSLKELIIEEGVKSIGSYAFAYINSIESITIPASVETISDYAFFSINSIESIFVNSENKNYCDINGVLYSKDKKRLILLPPKSTVESFTLADETEIIADNAIRGKFLKSVNLKENVSELNYLAFNSCNTLENINVSGDNQTYSSKDGILFNKDKTELVYYPLGKTETHYTLEPTVKVIGSHAVYSNKTLSSVTLPDALEEIGEYAFSNCSLLEDISIPTKVKLIKQYAFNTKISSAAIHSFDCVFEDKAFSVNSLKIYACSGSSAEAYAKANSFTFTSQGHSMKTTADGHGNTVKTCSYCGYTEISGTGVEVKHSYVAEVIPPTCTEQGYTKHTCTVCNATYFDEYTEATGHNEITVKGVAPTCTQTGLSDGIKCEKCGAVIEEQKILPTTGHSYVTKTVACAAFEKEGKAVELCRYCNEIKGESTIPALANISCLTPIIQYNKGKTKQPEISVTDSNGNEIDSLNYSIQIISRADNKVKAALNKTGQYRLRVNMKNEYEGTKDLYISVIPSKVKLKKAAVKKGKAVIKWKKSAGVSGYQLIVAKNKKFTKSVKVYKINKKKTSCILKKLKKNKKYFYKLRSYKTVKVDGKKTKMYSKYSKAKKIKLK